MVRIGEPTLFDRLVDAMACVWNLCLPMDRPSPVFTLFAVLFNSVEIIRGCTVALSATCSGLHLHWSSVGTVNAMVNVIYALTIMWRMRLYIDKGIPMHLGITRLFFCDPVNITFMVFIVWEAVWMSIAAQMTTDEKDICVSHLSYQFVFLSVFIILGSGIFVLTFMTEFLKTPRWRIWANANHRKRFRHLNMASENHALSLSFDVRSSAAENGAAVAVQDHCASQEYPFNAPEPKAFPEAAVSDAVEVPWSSLREGATPPSPLSSEAQEPFRTVSGAREGGNVFPALQAERRASRILHAVHERRSLSSTLGGNVVAAMPRTAEKNPAAREKMLTPGSVVIEFPVSDTEEGDEGVSRPNVENFTNASSVASRDSAYSSKSGTCLEKK